MKNQRPWQDSKLQSPDSKSGALSIRPQGHTYICVKIYFKTLYISSQMYWIHPYQRYSNRYSKFLIIPHGLSIEECYSALAPYQGNVFLHWLVIRGKSFCFFWLSVMRNSFCVGSFFLRWLILSALTQCMGKVTSIRWHMTHSHILIICSFCDVFLTEAFGIPHS